MRTNYKRWILFIAILLALETVAQAQSPKQTRAWGEIVEAVTKQNPEIQYYQAEISKAKGAVFNSQKFNNPELGMDLGRKDSSDSGVNMGQGLAWEISYAQKFEYPGRIKLRETIAKKQVSLAELQLNRFKLALTNKAKYLALDLYEAQQNREATQSIAKKVQALVDVLSKREAAGPALALERKLIEGSAISFRQRALQFSGAAEKLSVELNTLSATEVAARYQVEVPHFGRHSLLPNQNFLETLALENNPDVLIKKAELLQQGLKVQLSENEQKPSFTIRPFYREEEAGELERTVGIGFSVPLPIYNDNSGNIAIERAQTTQTEANLRALELEIKGQIAALYASYKLQSEQVDIFSSKSINSLYEAAQEAEKQYNLSVISVATYLQLQEQYLDNLLLHRAAQIQMLKDISELERVVGQEIAMQENK